jgi:oligopeptide/dipeptide ABC transporter ATP-binding protein
VRYQLSVSEPTLRDRRHTLDHPLHPYTRGLMSATPDHLRPRVLETMLGVSAGAGEWPSGCPFVSRCLQRVSWCDSELPELNLASEEQSVRCFEWRRTPKVAWTIALNQGTICEQGPTAELMRSAKHGYTQRLLGAAPSLSAAIDAWETVGIAPDELQARHGAPA